MFRELARCPNRSGVPSPLKLFHTHVARDRSNRPQIRIKSVDKRIRGSNTRNATRGHTRTRARARARTRNSHSVCVNSQVDNPAGVFSRFTSGSKRRAKCGGITLSPHIARGYSATSRNDKGINFERVDVAKQITHAPY